MDRDGSHHNFTDFLNAPLYEEYNLHLEDMNEARRLVKAIRYPDKKVEAFCVECGELSFFELPYQNQIKPSEILNYGGFIVEVRCLRNSEHRIYIGVLVSGNKIIKIGQFPSIASHLIPQLKPYRKILGEAKYKELKTAIGLKSHDVGIGSFVYLRRIFEHLIYKAYLNAKDEHQWNDENYNKAHITEKIQLLADHLPNFLVKNRTMYSVLSLGVHTLSDEECLKHFDILLTGILVILQEELEKLNKKKMVEQAENAIQSLTQQLSADKKNKQL